MFQQSAYETVMYAFCRRAELEDLNKLRVLDEIFFQQFFQIRILYGRDQRLQFPVHFFNIVFAHRKIVRRIIAALIGPAHAADIDLKRPCEADDLAHHIDIIQIVELVDSAGIRLPDFCVNGSRFILQNYIIIGLAVLGGCRLSVLAQVYASHPASFS